MPEFRLITIILSLSVLFGLGCAATQERPECSDARLAEIEAAYMAEIMEACDGQHYDTCLERLKIDKRYDAIREEWVQCK